jgi:RNA polymerase sigma factor (sigma-70 family)
MRKSPDTDEALLLSGEPEDFGRFYDRYVQSLLAYFQRRTRDPEAAADLTAETFAAALHARPRFSARATPASVWLFAIAHHKLTDYHRSGSAESRMRRRLGIERLSLATEDMEMIRMLGEDVALQLISELPPEQRDAIREHVFEDRDYGDIARDHMASEATVRKRVSRGLSALRARVGGVR